MSLLLALVTPPDLGHGGFYELRPTFVIYKWNVDQSENAAFLSGLPDDDQLLRRQLAVYGFTSRYPQPWSYAAGSVNTFGAPDNDLVWRNPLYSLERINKTPDQSKFDEQSPVLTGLPDDDLVWINPNQPSLRPYVWPQQSSFDEQIPSPTGLPDADEVWTNPNRPLVWPLQYPQQASFDEQTPILTGLPDDDQLAPRVVQSPPWLRQYAEPYSFDSADSGMVVAASIVEDEPFIPLPSQRRSVKIQFIVGTSAPNAVEVSGMPDDDSTNRSVRQVYGRTNQYPQPWFTAAESGLFTPTGLPDSDEFAVLLPFKPDQTTLFGPWSYGGEDTAAASVYDDTRYTPVFVQRGGIYPQPWSFASGESGLFAQTALDVDFNQRILPISPWLRPPFVSRADNAAINGYQANTDVDWQTPFVSPLLVVKGLTQWPFDEQAVPSNVVVTIVDDTGWVDPSIYRRMNDAAALLQLRVARQIGDPANVRKRLLYITRMNDWLDFEALHRSIVGGP